MRKMALETMFLVLFYVLDRLSKVQLQGGGIFYIYTYNEISHNGWSFEFGKNGPTDQITI